MDFYGPTISCDTLKNSAFADRIDKTIANHTIYSWAGNISYVGFVPTSRNKSTSPTESEMWEDYAIEGLNRALDRTMSYEAPTVDVTAYETDRGLGGNPATFYVVTPERMGVQANKTVECQLYNSSFAINFTFDNGLQDIKYNTERLNGVTALAADNCRLGRQLHRCNPVTAYFSLMNAMGDLLLGTQWHSGEGVYPTQRTSIGYTTLIETEDMHYFHYEKPNSLIGNMSMADALEQLFINMTISLFSDSQFLYVHNA